GAVKRVEVIRSGARESNVVVVVSAMSGVTNRLIEAATLSEAGDRKAVAAIFEELRKRHGEAVNALICSTQERDRLSRKLHELFQEGDCLCQGTILLRELTRRSRGLSSSLGARLRGPVVAAG